MATDPTERVHRPLGQMLWHNFLGGIAWGIGVTLGLSILFGTLGYLGSKVDWIPVVGKFFSDVTKAVEGNRPQIQAPQRQTR